MRFKDRDPEKYEECVIQVKLILAVAGLDGLMEILADIAQRNGDEQDVFSDPAWRAYWLNAAAQIDSARTKIKE